MNAFAIAALGVRNAGMAEAAIHGIKPAYPDELTFLGVAWPEMAGFLAANSLANTTYLDAAHLARQVG